MYPQNNDTFRAALAAYAAPPELADQIDAARARGSIVDQCVQVFAALRGAPDLSREGLGVLLGAAHLIAQGGWWQLGPEAEALIAARAPDYTPDYTPPIHPSP